MICPPSDVASFALCEGPAVQTMQYLAICCQKLHVAGHAAARFGHCSFDLRKRRPLKRPSYGSDLLSCHVGAHDFLARGSRNAMNGDEACRSILKHLFLCIRKHPRVNSLTAPPRNAL